MYSARWLKQQSAYRHVAPPDILSWFRANQSLLFLFSAACLAEKQHIPILLSLGLTQPELEHTIYRTGGEHANHYTSDAVAVYCCIFNKKMKRRKNTTPSEQFQDLIGKN
jgi:hypothetical protein